MTYYHQLLGAILVHPEHKEVFPLAPEPILKQDGVTKGRRNNKPTHLTCPFTPAHVTSNRCVE